MSVTPQNLLNRITALEAVAAGLPSTYVAILNESVKYVTPATPLLLAIGTPYVVNSRTAIREVILPPPSLTDARPILIKRMGGYSVFVRRSNNAHGFLGRFNTPLLEDFELDQDQQWLLVAPYSTVLWDILNKAR